jgi:hypothetical protein
LLRKLGAAPTPPGFSPRRDRLTLAAAYGLYAAYHLLRRKQAHPVWTTQLASQRQSKRADRFARRSLVAAYDTHRNRSIIAIFVPVRSISWNMHANPGQRELVGTVAQRGSVLGNDLARSR